MQSNDLYKENPDDVSSLIKEMIEEDERGFKTQWAKVAERSVNFLNGNQMLDGLPLSTTGDSPVLSSGKDKGMRGYEVNEIEPITKTLLSYMTRQKPTIEAFSLNSDDIEGKALAKVSEEVSQAKYDLDDEMANSLKSANWLLSIGTVFRKDYWDSGLGQYVDMGDGDPAMVQDQIQQKGQKTGGNDVAILSGMSVSTDMTADDFNKLPWIREDYLMDVDWARDSFGGYIDDPMKIKETNRVASFISQFEALKQSVPYLSSGEKVCKGKALITELYCAPNDDKNFPQGRMIIKAGDVIVYCTKPGEDNPYYMPYEPTMWHPYTGCIYEEYLGRLFGKGLVEQLIPIQRRINEIYETILHNANTIAKPNILAPERSLKKGIINGRGSNIYTYTPHASGQVPQSFQGIPLPTQFFNELQNLSDKMVQIAGTNFIMQGQQPTNVSAASAISQLLENANNQHSPIMMRFARYHEQGFIKKLRILKKFGVNPDEKLNSYLKTLAKKSYKTQFKIFVAATDLSDDVNLKIEPSTMIPKSPQRQNELYIDMIKQGVFGPIGDPTPQAEALRNQLLEKMGLPPLNNDQSVEVKKAKWENERILLMEPVEVSEFDNNEIHLSEHVKMIQDPNFLENASDEQKKYAFAHIMETRNAVEAKKQAAMDAQMQQQILQNAGGVTANPSPPVA